MNRLINVITRTVITFVLVLLLTQISTELFKPYRYDGIKCNIFCMYEIKDFSGMISSLTTVYFMFLVLLPIFYVSGLNKLLKIKPVEKLTKGIFSIIVLISAFIVQLDHDEFGFVRLFLILLSFIYVGTIMLHDKIAKTNNQ